MCLILLAWRAHPDYRLVVAANRDEYFKRPTAAARFWDGRAEILAGRDLEAGGTWLGVTLRGRFAAVTNYRNPAENRPGAPTRGRLVSDYLRSTSAPGACLAGIATRSHEYNGFSLLAGDFDALHFVSNRGMGPVAVEPGLHGLSNHLLDTPWPKVKKGTAALAALLRQPFNAEACLSLLDDTEPAANEALPSTGVSPEMEERLSPLRILPHGGYGTRCSTVLCVRADGEVEFHERSYGADGAHGTTLKSGFRLPNCPGSPAPSQRAESRLPGTSAPAP